MAPVTPNFRAVTPADTTFLQQLYASTREAEMRLCGWPAEAIARFLHQQFELRQAHYLQHFVGADHWLLEQAGQPIGRLSLLWGPDTLLLIDIALLPAWCGRGLGSALLRGMIEQADSRGLAIELHVEAGNPARRLYQRLGFEVVGEQGLYLKMQRPLSQNQAALVCVESQERATAPCR